MQNIDTEIAAGFYKPIREKIILPPVVDYAPTLKPLKARAERISKAWAARSPHSKRMATVTQYTPFLALALLTAHATFV
jgi:hypothetical protein